MLGAYFVSQIGKYLPGNVAHHIGRVVLLRRQHIPAPTIVAVMTLETIWGIGVALALGCIALLEFGDGILPPGLRPALVPVLRPVARDPDVDARPPTGGPGRG